jgi:hypothetical protein
MPDSDKLTEIKNLFHGLSQEEKGVFMNELAEDDDLMSVLLNILVNRNDREELPGEVKETGTYVDFLRRIKG